MSESARVSFDHDDSDASYKRLYPREGKDIKGASRILLSAGGIKVEHALSTGMLGFSGKRKYSDWECSGCKHPFISEQWLKRHEKKCKAVREQAERAFQLGEENENRQKRRRVTEAEKFIA
ncbi:hypothetical protein K466DRAFT_664714 [Polyporus arcularius HHB13444]|uniref:Uncharacterized protein n=1 Tax=Polyporus arcularius HHB13444 TaxID=1314778 RepID=A0A5C3P631_9APHY|nr:hypothetical protein K466DRAFT_664714 [Polyporus arcularius HHB13444]